MGRLRQTGGAPPVTIKPDMMRPQKKYMCSMCGATFEAQQGNFPKTTSPTHQFNDFYPHICKRCLAQYYIKKVEQYDQDEAKAMRRVCELLDVYWSYKIFEGTAGASTQSARVFEYLKRLCVKGVAGKTFDDTLLDEANGLAMPESEDNAEEVSKEAIKIFGTGYPTEAYSFMLKAYKGYVNPLGKLATPAQIKTAQLLAMLEYRTRESIKEGAKDAAQLTTSFRNTLKDSGFDITSKPGEVTEEPFGVWLRSIETFTPAEYVAQDDVYKDIDKMSYLKRFLVRPLKNLFKGRYEPDQELSITDEDLDAGGDDE